MYTALRLDLPVLPVPDQRDRNDLLIVLDMFQVLERRVELGHIEVGDIVDVAKPVVPVLPRLADEVVSIALAEQTVGLLMLLRIIYDALDLNSHFKLFQLVSRRGCGRGLGLAAFDFNVSINVVRAANQVPRAILPPPSEEGIAVAGRRLRGNGESMGLLILRGRLVGLAGRCAGAAVGIIVQRESRQNGRAFEIVICGVLAVGKQGACALAASVAAASGPTDVVDLVIVNTLPDILCIGKTEGIVVDVVLVEVNGDVIAADA